MKWSFPGSIKSNFAVMSKPEAQTKSRPKQCNQRHRQTKDGNYGFKSISEAFLHGVNAEVISATGAKPVAALLQSESKSVGVSARWSQWLKSYLHQRQSVWHRFCKQNQNLSAFLHFGHNG